ncbi:MAG TPA: tetratricopeptide repeat protein [Gemmataceae bacterium]|nr:tetratricopeptide repeat protein [Gemmataceae bacterium]
MALPLLFVSAGCFHPAMAQQALLRGDMLLVQKDYERAIASYTQALENDPTLIGALHNRGIALRNQGNFDQALIDIDRAVELGMSGSRVLVERARTKLMKLAADAAGDRDKLAAAFAKDDPLQIAADLDRAMAMDPLHLDALAELLHGAVRVMQGRDADAEQDFKWYLVRRSKARDELDDAIKKWKKERPILDLSLVDELSKLPARGNPWSGRGIVAR